MTRGGDGVEFSHVKIHRDPKIIEFLSFGPYIKVSSPIAHLYINNLPYNPNFLLPVVANSLRMRHHLPRSLSHRPRPSSLSSLHLDLREPSSSPSHHLLPPSSLGCPPLSSSLVPPRATSLPNLLARPRPEWGIRQGVAQISPKIDFEDGAEGNIQVPGQGQKASP